MERALTQELTNWKCSPFRKPLLLLGARQVGKTWLMQDFGKRHYKNVIYVRFDRNAAMKELFETSNYDMKALLLHLQMQDGTAIIPGETLIILDEIQECPAALTSLKYFCEDLPEHHVMAAGSLLGVHDQQGTGFPVGKVNTLQLYPLSFCEFLSALNRHKELKMIETRQWNILKTYSDRYTQLLKLYFYIGGMPEAIKRYLSTQDFNQVRIVQNSILEDYEKDFGKHVPKNLSAKLFSIWNSIPEQLAKENKRFIYSEIKKGARAKDFEDALDWLRRAGLIEQVNRITTPSLPLSAYKDNSFKLFFVDIGLLAAKSKLPSHVLIEKSNVFKEFKGALTEQFVQQQLRASCGITPFFWRADNFQSELDFAFQADISIIPVEVKAETNTKAKSLLNYCRKYLPDIAVRSSMNDFNRQILTHAPDKQTILLDIPLYAISQIDKLCRQELPPNISNLPLPPPI